MTTAEKHKAVEKRLKAHEKEAAKKVNTAVRYEHSKAKLAVFPADVGAKGGGLLELDVSWNDIREIPMGAFRRILELEEMDLSYNALTLLPEEMSVLNKLRLLDLQSNNIIYLPTSFEQLHLEELYMANNQLQQFPHEVRDMGSLRVLDLASNRIVRVGRTLGTLRQLQQLSLAENLIPTLPPDVGKLFNLRVINVSSNNLTTLPMELGLCQNLEVLAASNNRIESIPSHLADCRKLRVLDLQHNAISVLPIEICYINTLQIALLADNRIITLPDLMDRLGQLLTLDVSRNRLRRLPPSLGACANLKTIHCEGNPDLQIPDCVLVGGPTAIKAYLLTVVLDSVYIEGLMEEQVNDLKAQQREAKAALMGDLGGDDNDEIVARAALGGGDDAPTTLTDGDKINQLDPTELAARQREAQEAAEKMRARLAQDPRLERKMLATKKHLQREFRAQVEYTRAVLALKDFTYGASPINAINKAKKNNVLDLKGTALRTLVPEIAAVKSITALDLRNNSITGTGRLLRGFKHLQMMDLSMNLLAELPDEPFPALEHLAANCNQLKAVPESYANSKNLKTLSLSDNLLTDLPQSLDSAPLETLLLANNRLTGWPMAAQGSLTLRKLNLAANQVRRRACAAAQPRRPVPPRPARAPFEWAGPLPPARRSGSFPRTSPSWPTSRCWTFRSTESRRSPRECRACGCSSTSTWGSTPWGTICPRRSPTCGACAA